MKAKGHVFIVDDDAEIRLHLGNLLRHVGRRGMGNGIVHMQQVEFLIEHHIYNGAG